MKKDEDDFKNIYFATFDELSKYVYFRVNNVEDAQDIVSDVYLDYYQHVFKKNKKVDHVIAYLIQMAHHQLISFYKDKQFKVTQSELMDAQIDNIVAPDDVELEVFEKFESIRLWQTVNQLNPLERKIIIGKFRYDMTFKEIAEKLSINENTIKTIYYRSLQQLKKILNK